MSQGVGLRIFTKINRPDRALVEQFRGIPTSNINDQMNRLYNTNGSIRPMNNVPLLGTAFTVKAPLGDNMMFHRALDLAQPGDVIVVDGGGCVEVYETVEYAEARNAYLAKFDGTFIASGSHTVCGTSVVRTSNNLTATQQQELEAAIIDALMDVRE